MSLIKPPCSLSNFLCLFITCLFLCFLSAECLSPRCPQVLTPIHPSTRTKCPLLEDSSCHPASAPGRASALLVPTVQLERGRTLQWLKATTRIYDSDLTLHLPTMREPRFNPWLARSPREGMASHPLSILFENPMDGAALVGYTVHGAQRVGHDWSDFTFCQLKILGR